MKFFIIFLLLTNYCFSQYQEATITRTTSTNSVFPRQFPSMTVRKMNENEYWIFESLGTNTIFHRQFPTYIVRRETYGRSHINQKWGVYRTTSTNSVFPRQFPDRYISGLEPSIEEEKITQDRAYNYRPISNSPIKESVSNMQINNSYTYSRSLRSDGKSSYSAEVPE